MRFIKNMFSMYTKGYNLFVNLKKKKQILQFSFGYYFFFSAMTFRLKLSFDEQTCRA